MTDYEVNYTINFNNVININSITFYENPYLYTDIPYKNTLFPHLTLNEILECFNLFEKSFFN